MATSIIVAGEIATVRVPLRQVDARPGDLGFADLFSEGDDGDPELRRTLASDVAEVVCEALDSHDLSVDVELRRGSLEVVAVIAVGKLVVKLDTFLEGLREIRRLAPEVVRTRVASWVGYPIAASMERLEVGPGMLCIEEQSSKDAVEDPDAERSAKEVAVDAAATFLILFLIVVVIFVGAGVLT